MFNQTFESPDMAVVALLVVLEGILSIDNALVLGLLAKRLPKRQQQRALTYGLVGAFAFRLVAIATAQFLLRWRWVKLAGGGYLVYVALKHFIFERRRHEPGESEPALGVLPEHPGFWQTVAVIELTDIAFAIDSILAAIALVGPSAVSPHPKLWVVITGGFIGVVLMRFAAVLFIRLLEKFPRFEMSAYLLVIVIGGKLVGDWWFNSDPKQVVLDFHSPSSAAFWVFWALMAICLGVGFVPDRQRRVEG